MSTAPPAAEQPVDKAAYAIHFLAGAAVLAPWNSLISASDYFDAAVPGQPTARLMTAAYLPWTLVVMVALLGRHEATRPRARIVLGFAAFAGLMVALPVLDATVGSTLAVILTVASLVGVVDGVAQPAVYGEAALLPSIYTQAIVGGTAVSGVVTSLLRVLTKAATPPNTPGGGRASVGAFFGSSALECAVAAGLYAWALPRTRVWRALAEGHAEIARDSVAILDATATPKSGVQLTRRVKAGGSGDGTDSPAALLPDAEAPPPTLAAPPPHHHLLPDRRRVARHVWPAAAAMVCVYAVTISLFPGAFADQVPRFGDWYFILLTLLFNAADLTGKMLPAAPAVGRAMPASKTLLALAVARALFVPALIFAARARSAPAAATLVALVSAALGVSNGYVTAGCFIKASEGLTGRDAEDAGTVAVLALVVGLITGSALSFLFLLGGGK